MTTRVLVADPGRYVSFENELVNSRQKIIKPERNAKRQAARMPVTAVVISFEEDYSCLAAVQETLSMEELQKFVGREVQFDVSKTKIAKGKVTGLDGDLVQVSWQDTPIGLGQSSMMRIMDS